MLKFFVASVLLVAIAALSGCAFPEGYHRDSTDYYDNQPSGYSGGHGGHTH